jgi:hypothetical protein
LNHTHCKDGQATGIKRGQPPPTTVSGGVRWKRKVTHRVTPSGGNPVTPAGGYPACNRSHWERYFATVASGLSGGAKEPLVSPRVSLASVNVHFGSTMACWNWNSI